MTNKPENTLPWDTKKCEFNSQWTSVGYITRGPSHGVFVPCHHWADKRDADAHADYLNRGFSREDAREMVMVLVHKEEPSKDNPNQ